ncbi:hypothetical protein LTR36_008848 [Oleoguttula mirabilis]|uniref:PX domain-containing protein n=1 Tax=Oleoguttula mirabilis TaxID=1507867 RepID=A0AAV9J7J2_9PEZI|nr:hypothetical protein LTR36_008848 [Oleoguttula mirabilis]
MDQQPLLGSNSRPRTSSRANGLHVQLTPTKAPRPIPIQRSDTIDSQLFVDAPESPQPPQQQQQEQDEVARQRQRRERAPSTMSSIVSVPPAGSVLTGKQEHYLKRELLARQTHWEVQELSHPTALQRFGAPFRSDAGEVMPEDSELPLLRYIFVRHVRNFPFLNQAKEREFWQDKLQVFLESFANKHISSSDDRLEETKRAKLAIKASKLVELMMVSGIPTASGYEERIRFSEMEVVERGANEQGLVVNVPQGHEINGWDVNVAGVRIVTQKRHVRNHAHAEFILRVKRKDEGEIYVARRFGDFSKMHKKLRLELPGKVLPPLPRKNKAHSYYSGDDDSDAESLNSVSMSELNVPTADNTGSDAGSGSGFRGYLASWTGGGGSSSSNRHARNQSRSSAATTSSPRASIDSTAGTSPTRTPPAPATPDHPHLLVREEQRVSLRASLRAFLSNEAIATSTTMQTFLTHTPLTPTPAEQADIAARKTMDEKRLAEQRRFFDLARARAAALDVHMEAFRRKVIERNGLRDLFAEIKRKDKLADLEPEYRKFAEWLRIEVAATLYHLFLAEDNSPELFAQAKRIHSLVPYGTLKQVIRFTNPAAVMSSVLDIFMAQPLGAKSLLQRIFGLALGDGIRSIQKSIDALTTKIDDPVFCEKLRNYTEADEDVKRHVRAEAMEEKVDLLVKVLQTDTVAPELAPEQVGRAFNAYVAWNNAVENIDTSMRAGAELYAQLKQLLKLHTRLRDKRKMLEMVEEPNTLRLFRDLFTIFYEPLVRVYKSANVYNSVTDFARFADDAIATIEKAQRQDVSADPNQTVQSFIDLCERHEEALYKFVHEVHAHDNGLFDKLMTWIEGILDFLRNGPRSGGKLDMNALFKGAVEAGTVDARTAVGEINGLIKWQMARKRWHLDKTRQKMASGPSGAAAAAGQDVDALSGLASTFQSSDFGINAMDLQDLDSDDDGEGGGLLSSDDEDEDDLYDSTADPIEAERKRRKRNQDLLKRTAGEPVKPGVVECGLLMPGFLGMVRGVLAE